MNLTPAIVAELTNQSLQEIISLAVCEKQISHIDDISACISLKKLDLSQNCLESKDSLSGLQYNKGLTMLNLSHNSLSSIDLLKNLHKLVVLNLSYNKIVTLPTFLHKFSQLKGLVLNNNEIGTIQSDLKLPSSLNTLILSNNSIENIDSLLAKGLVHLTKLSLSHNHLRSLPTGMRETFDELKELRLANNKISRLELHSLPHSLEILDLANNLISQLEDVSVLSNLKRLVQVSFKGCPICENIPDYKEEIKRLIPSLRILDGERFDEKFLRRKKRKSFE